MHIRQSSLEVLRESGAKSRSKCGFPVVLVPNWECFRGQGDSRGMSALGRVQASLAGRGVLFCPVPTSGTGELFSGAPGASRSS